MAHELDGLSAPVYDSPLHLGGTGAVFDSAASGLKRAEAALSPALRRGGLAYHAVRNLLRIHPASWYASDETVALRRWAGIAFSMGAWLVLLVGLAHLFVAAMHNRDGELGLGLESTLIGARSCLVAGALAVLGVPLWVAAERRIRQKREQLQQEKV
jgi:hypothetical protein